MEKFKSRENIKNEFMSFLESQTGHNPVEENEAIRVCKSAVHETVRSGGEPKQKREILNEYLKEIGITDNNPKTYAKALNKVLLEHTKEMEKAFPTKAEERNLSAKESKVVKMFDSLFTEALDETNPKQWIDEVVIPAHLKELNGSSNEVWWKGAIEHAVNSGGLLWQPTFERMQTMENFGLIPQGSCAKDENSKGFIKEFEQADKKYARFMYDYLKLKGLTTCKKREEAIRKDNQQSAKKTHCYDYECGR